MPNKKIEHPLIMQGFDLDPVAIASEGVTQTFTMEQDRGDVIGIDYLPKNENVSSSYFGQTFEIAVGGQQVIKDANCQEFAGFSFNPNRLLPIPLDSKGGQTISGRLINEGTIFDMSGQIAVFYENPYDKTRFGFDFKQGSKLTLKRQSFTFSIGAGLSDTFKFTTARGYGDVIGIEPNVTLQSDEIQTSFTKFTLFMSGITYLQDVSAMWFSKYVNRRQKRFPVKAKPSSTNRIFIDNTLNPNPFEMTITTFFIG